MEDLLSKQNISRLKVILLAVSIIATAALVVKYIDFKKDVVNPHSELQKKFLSYFDRPYISELKYNRKKRLVRKEWIYYKAGMGKEIEYDNGKLVKLQLIRGNEVKYYNSKEKFVRIENLNRDTDPSLLQALKRAAHNKLSYASRDKDTVYFTFDTEFSGDTEGTGGIKTQVGLDKENGRLRSLREVFGKQKSVLEVRSIKRLSPSMEKEIFNTDEIPKDQLDKDTQTLQLSSKGLTKFKYFKPFWLGKSFNGYSLRTIIGDKETEGRPNQPNLYLSYGDRDKPALEMNEEPANTKNAVIVWRGGHVTNIGGAPAKISGNSGEFGSTILIKKDNVLIRIDAYKFKYNKKLIKMIANQLKSPCTLKVHCAYRQNSR